MKLLFLDFDGVLHPYRAEVDQLFCRLELLQQWLRRWPEVDVVISSSWRTEHPLDELREFFAEDIQARVLGLTPVLARDGWTQFDGELPPIRFEREAEVLRWLSQHDAGWKTWAALDDQLWLFKPFCKQLVSCDPRVGLSVNELTQLDRVLGLG